MPNVGASRAVSGLLVGLDWDSRRPATFLFRIWGFLLIAGVTYTQIVSGSCLSNVTILIPWLLTYAVYTAGLEIARHYLTQFYDAAIFRFLRTFANIVFASWLISVAPHDKALLALLFAIPIFASIVYFQGRTVPVLVFCSALIALFIAGTRPAHGAPLQSTQFIATILMLVLIAFTAKAIFDRAQLNSAHMTNVAASLHSTLDLTQLLPKAISIATDLTGAASAMIVVVDPAARHYIAHAATNLTLLEGRTIEDVVRRCSILKTGSSFETSDASIDLPHGTIYSANYNCAPRTIVGHALQKDGQVFGAITVMHDRPNGFDRLSKKLLLQFVSHVTEAIAASLKYRQIQLREARGQELSKGFALASTEADIGALLIEGASGIVHADGYVLHHFDSATGLLNSWRTQGPIVGTEPSLELGVGIAGKAVSLREPVRVNETQKHPWFVPSRDNSDIRSLLVAPLNTESTVFGSLSLFSRTPDRFKLEDEFILASLAHQAAVALERIRDFSRWQQQGGILRQIIEEVQAFDIERADSDLARQIAEAAQRILQFEFVRIRLLDRDTGDLVTVAAVGASADEFSTLGHRAPLTAFEPLFDERYRAGQSYLLTPDSTAWGAVDPSLFFRPVEVTGHAWTPDHALLTPIVNSKGRVGLLSLDQPAFAEFPSPHVIEAIGVFATAAGWALERAVSHRQLLAQQRQTEALIESASAEFATCRSVNAFGEVVTRLAAQLFSASCCCLYIVKNGELVLVHSSNGGATSDLQKPLPMTTAAGIERSRVTNDTIPSDPPDCHAQSKAALCPNASCRVAKRVPIRSRQGHLLGELLLQTSLGGAEPWTDEHEKRLKYLVNQIPPALEVIDRYESVLKWERDGLEDDLHELVNWFHGGVQLPLEAAEVWLDGGDVPRALAIVRETIKNARAANKELKSVHAAVTSRYMAIDDCGEALQAVADAWRHRVESFDNRLCLRVTCQSGLILPVHLRNAFLRVASGAIANAILHSGALKDPLVTIDVEVSRVDGQTTLIVKDTGVGSDHIVEGWGITRMRDHVDQLQRNGIAAHLDIRSQPRQGTRVTLTASEDATTL